jgi:zinc protease
VEFLSRHLDAGLKMFLDCLTDPRFPEKELEKERLLVVEEIRNKEDDPGTLAADLFARTLFEDHPYGMDVMGTEKTVSSFTAGSLLEFYRRHLTPQGLTLVVVGDADPQEVAELVEEGTAGWDPGQPAVRKAGAPVRPGPREAVSSKDKEQAHIMLGFPGTTLGSGDRYAVEVLAAMLGGQSGRLFLELREKRSMAYTVTAFAMEGLDPGYFAVYMACAPEKTDEALGAVKAELERFNASGAEPAEAERARNYLIGAQEISMQRVSARAAQMAFNEAYGLGYDETFRYAERISAVDAAALREAAARYITPDKAVTAVIRPGNGEKDRKKKRK